MELKIGTIIIIINLSIITILVMIGVIAKKRESTPLLFPKNATIKQKITIILCMLVCILTSFGIIGHLYFHILINDNVISALIIPTLVASLLIIIYLYRALLNKTSVVSKHVANKLKQGPMKFILSMCALVPIVLAAVIIIAIPSTLHMFTSKSGDLVVTVKEKPLWYQSRVCNGRISIQENTYPIINNKVCGISENDWNSLVPGDKIKLSGKKSYFGFSYDYAQKIR